MTFEFRSAPSAEHALTHTTPAAGPPRSADADDVVTAHDVEQGDRCVGHVHAARTDLTVPGEVRLATAAITGIDVDETWRGRGVLTGMMQRLLTEAHARGQVLATISSPHSSLHGRLGFGPASDACAVEIDAARARPVHRPADGTLQIIPTSGALDVVVDVYERCARRRTGTLGRTAEHWKRRLAPPGNDGSATSEVVVHHDSTGRPVGYAHYDVAGSVGVVRDMWGEDPEIERALWGHLVTIDTVATWRSPRRPVGDPIRHALADLRAYRIERQVDELWVRILDVDVALGTRTYNSNTRTLTVRVTDPIISPNNGTWRVDSYGSFRSQGEPDIEIGIAELSAVFLGGTSPRELADAGHLVERRRGAVGDAHELLAERPNPFCGTDL